MSFKGRCAYIKKIIVQSYIFEVFNIRQVLLSFLPPSPKKGSSKINQNGLLLLFFLPSVTFFQTASMSISYMNFKQSKNFFFPFEFILFTESSNNVFCMTISICFTKIYQFYNIFFFL